MARVSFIKTPKGDKYIDDPVAFHEDTHKFSSHEEKIFTCRTIPGTLAEVKAAYIASLPERKRVAFVDGKYIDIHSIEFLLSGNGASIKEIWKDGIQYKEIVKPPFKLARWNGIGWVENISRHFENTLSVISIEEVKSINGTSR